VIRLTVVRPTVVVAAALIVLLVGCGEEARSGEPRAASPISSWRFTSLEVDGEPVAVDKPLFLDITDDGFQASTTCNSIGGHFGGELWMTAMGCPSRANEIERYFAQALRVEPTEQGDQLVFDDGHIRLVYESFVDPLPADLFAVLGDADASVDESKLPPEQATGTVPPVFEALVPIPSPSTDIDLFLADLDGNICLVYGTATAIDKFCQAPRAAAEISYATDIPFFEQPTLRLALIPDRFASAAAERPDLGKYSANILIVGADAPQGTHTLADAEGNTFRLVVPSPWTDPMAASRTDPDASVLSTPTTNAGAGRDLANVSTTTIATTPAATSVVTAVAIAQANDFRAASAALDDAKVRWSAAHIASYRLSVSEDLNFWTQGCTWMTVVSNGVLTDTEVDPSSTSTACVSVDWTVEQLHELISQWVESINEFPSPQFGEHTLDVRFDDIGVPTTMVFDLANGADEESSMHVTFTPTA
jgi:heat shock protein HslJ